ncbi:transporter substrate-binding domain-containing protein [Thalassomonas viridans]|uniref:Transporter substrate-binding domain-containing protein n=1 Tax=Thalassomonas viridans TaxID=137584 RepID=A0AAE9Z363_9GAMM|nr:ABC transporter substrate-binding protein [Thalassomonas viridans]WDE05229.1 transporter substrate-binding domain-containing protein [Thalassomonas viridans]
MHYRQVKIFILSWLLACASLGARADELSLRVVTENFPPYNYQTDKGELAGVMNHIVQELLKRLESKQNIEVLPWARAYKIALTEPNTLIYSILKTPPREEKFHWLLSFLSLDINMYALPRAHRGQISQFREVQQQSIGIMRSSSHENYIRQHFTPHNNKIITNISYLHLYQMHQRQRLDLLVAPRRLIDYLNQSEQTPPETRPKAIFKLPFPYQKKLYIALSKNSPAATVTRVKKALISMRDDGTIARLLARYQI